MASGSGQLWLLDLGNYGFWTGQTPDPAHNPVNPMGINGIGQGELRYG
jgi:hypothetical protein